MASFIQPITVATATANAVHAGDLGKIVFTGGRIFRVVKANSTIAAAASKGLVTAYTLGVPTWIVDLPGGVVTEDLVFVPVGQVGSTGTTSLIANDYFLGLVSGTHSYLAANTTLVKTAGQALAVNSLGQVQANAAVTAASVVTYPRNLLNVTNTAAATATGQAITGMVAGLI